MPAPIVFGTNARLKYLIKSNIQDSIVGDIIILRHALMWEQIGIAEKIFANQFSKTFSRDYKYVPFPSFVDGCIPVARICLRDFETGKKETVDSLLSELVTNIVELMDPGFQFPFAVGDIVTLEPTDMSIIGYPNRIYEPGSPLEICALHCKEEPTILEEDGMPSMRICATWSAILKTQESNFLAHLGRTTCLNFSLWVPVAVRTVRGDNLYVTKADIKSSEWTSRFDRFR